MSSVIDKVKAKVDNVLHKDKDNTTDTHSGTHAAGTHSGAHTTGTHTTGTHTTGTHTTVNDPTGPHSSHLANKADPRVDTDLPGAYGNTRSARGYAGADPTGPHQSHLSNKADPRVDSDQLGSHGNATSVGGPGYSGSDPTDPHDSRLLNKLDQRVNSDTAGPHGNAGSTRHSGQSTGLTGTPGHTAGYGSDPTGPHDTYIANRTDPRVDSSRAGGYGNTGSAGGIHTGHGLAGTAGHTGHSSTHHTGRTAGLTGTTGYGSDPTGPHDTHTANRVDPRVDSSHAGGYGNTTSAGGVHTSHGLSSTTGHTGTSTGYGSTDPTGPHDSRLANRADPRVDSDHVGGYGNTTSGTHHGTQHSSQYAGAGTGNQSVLGSGPGPASNTAGPHGNDMLNKLDPRVDSDLDGSKTYGGNKTSGI